MNIRPLSDLSAADFAAGGAYAPTAANFPALKMFIPGTNAVGATVLTDTIGSQDITLASALVSSTAHTGFLHVPDSTDSTVTLTNPSGCMVLMLVADIGANTGGIVMGDTTYSTVFMGINNIAAAGCLVFDGTNYETGVTSTFPSAVGTGTIKGHSFAFTPSSRIDAYQYADASLASGVLTTVASTTGSASFPGAVAFSATSMLIKDLLTFCGFAMFNFASNPGDVPAATAWMTRQWYLAHKERADGDVTTPTLAIYPGWKDRT